jgi:hypothetical protein
LRHTARHRRDAFQLELAEHIVILGHGALSLEHLDEHSRLVVGVCGEGLTLLGRDGGVALDQSSHDTSGGLDTERQRGHIQKEQVLQLLGLILTRQDSS